MAIRSTTDIARDMKAWLEARLRIVDTSSTTVLYSLLLKAMSDMLGEANTALGTIQTAQGIGDPANTDQFDLDDIAYNLSLTRKSPTASTGFVTFRRSTAPTSDLRIGLEDGSGGVVVKTGNDADGSVSFQTTQTVFFTSSTTKDSISGFYEVSAPITCQSLGTVGDLGAGTITVMVNSVSGVTACVNKVATANGKDLESNEELAVRMGSKIMGLQPGIIEGLRTIAFGQAGVLDASVVGPDDSSFQRSIIGAVDLVIKGSSPSTTIDTFTYNDPSPHLFSSRPVLAVGQVVSTVGLTQGSLLEGAQWSFSQDTVGEAQNSVSSNDHLSWAGTDQPNVGEDVVVSYTYDALIQGIQDIVDQDDGHFPAATVMVKQGTQVFLDMTFSIVRSGHVDSTSLRNNIATAISTYIASLGLGATIAQSVLVGKIKAVPGIRQLVLPFTTFARRGEGGADDITLTPYEYPSVDSTSLSITFTN